MIHHHHPTSRNQLSLTVPITSAYQWFPVHNALYQCAMQSSLKIWWNSKLTKYIVLIKQLLLLRGCSHKQTHCTEVSGKVRTVSLRTKFYQCIQINGSLFTMHSLQSKCTCKLFGHPLRSNLWLWRSRPPTLPMCKVGTVFVILAIFLPCLQDTV